MAGTEKKDLESFLSKVDEIETIVKGLNSKEDEEVKVAVKKADEKIAHLRAEATKVSKTDETPTGFNRSFINTSDSPKPGFTDPNIQTGMEQAAFMKVMEDDAKERSGRKKANEKEAIGIKLEANEAFKSRDYNQAIELYSKALRLTPDSYVLYTNRAQAKIKLEKFEEALSDCDWALRAFPNHTKAFVHQGKAYLALGRYEEARQSYKQGLQTDNKMEKLFADCLSEVDRCEEAKLQESKAQELFDAGEEIVTGLADIIEKVKKTGQLPLFYSGGFREITKLLNGVTEKTLLRTLKGLKFHVDHQMLNRCLSASPQSLSQEELDLVCAAVDMYQEACTGTENETNQEFVLKTGNLSMQLVGFLVVKLKGHGYHLQQSIVTLLHCLSISDIGRQLLTTQLDLSQLTNWVLGITVTDVPLAVSALAILNNLALHPTFRKQLLPVIEEQVLPAFIKLLQKTRGSTLAVLPSCINMVVNLSGDSVIRSKLSSNKDLWRNCLTVLKTLKDRKAESLIKEILEPCLSLLVNLSSETTPVLQNMSHDCCVRSLKLTDDGCSPEIEELCFRLTGLCLNVPQSTDTITWICDTGYLPVLLKALQSENKGLAKSALKCLTVCAKSNEGTKKFLISNNGLPTLLKILKCDDETMKGNAALCLGYCIESDKSACDSLTNTNIIQDLLVLARDGHNTDLQKNCGILLSKLALGNTTHLERLRELHGIEILHQACGKHLQ